jgi:electron transfer flavoprotein alpha subunit
VDAGFAPPAWQVGQSGRTVSPALYVACGVFGSLQHLAGMRTSRRVVAINRDPQAPIFRCADYGVVGDLHEVIPALVRELRTRPIPPQSQV